jgi:hypothetical protein
MMWKIYDYILINHAMERDVIQWDDTVFEIKLIKETEESFVVEGIEMSWDESVQFEIPDCHVVPIMMWY